MDRQLSPPPSPGSATGRGDDTQSVLCSLHDSRRARSLPLRIYLPATPRPRGLILFSHGLGGNRDGGARWLEHWATQGFAAVAIQHPGSDDSLLRKASPLALRRAFKAAMNPEELARRVDDLRFVIERIGRDPALPEAMRGIDRIGLAGHSFGAVTVQLLAGERRPEHPPQALDPRIKAALALSPSARRAGDGASLTQRFGAIQLPFMSITGSRDDGMGLSDITAANRELPFRHMPSGHKYLLVFAGGAHLDFAGQASMAESGVFRLQRATPVFEDALLQASTAFWGAHLDADAAAGDWLDTRFPATLRPDDRFERK